MRGGPPDRRSIGPVRLFAEFGYTIAFRHDGWWECLLARGAERWIGSGTSRRQSLDDAAGKALPSHAARSLFEGWRRAANALAPSAELDGCRTCAEDSPRQAPAASTLPAPEPAAEAPLAPAAAERTVPVVPPPPRTAAAPTEAEPKTALRVRPPKMPAAEAQARYAELGGDIDGAFEEAGLLEPERQRLLLLSWIARARAIEVQAASPEAFERTRAIARRLGLLAKIWWPGSVRALAIDVRPADCASEIPGAAGSDLSTWDGVAAAAEAALDAREDRDPDEVDAHGWADAAALEPAHPQADGVLLEVVAQIEKVANPVLRPSEAEDLVPAFATGVDPWNVDVPALVTAAMKVRWLRGAASDLELWGAAIGRLRWIASTLRARGAPIAQVLDPRHAPAGTWAQTLRYDPEKKRRQKERKALISTNGAPKPTWNEAEIRDWLRRALELGEALPNDRIAQVLEAQSVVEPVLAIDAPLFSEKRSQRTRLETIQVLLRRGPEPLAPAPVAPASDEEDDDSGPSFLDRLLQRLLGRTRGKRVLFVSNRNDPTIDEKLRELFAFEEVDHCEVKSSNVAARARSVEQGSYDMVLAATGFLSHSTEGVFRDAARRAQIPHVRVNRGRPLSVALALAREFGIRIPSGG